MMYFPFLVRIWVLRTRLSGSWHVWCTPFHISGTAGRIVLKYCVWVWTAHTFLETWSKCLNGWLWARVPAEQSLLRDTKDPPASCMRPVHRWISPESFTCRSRCRQGPHRPSLANCQVAGWKYTGQTTLFLGSVEPAATRLRNRHHSTTERLQCRCRK